MTRRPTIGRDPLDALLTPTVPVPAERPIPATRKPATASRKRERAAVPPAPPTASTRPARVVRVTYALPAELVAETRNAVVALSGPPVRLTLSALVVSALRRELEALRRKHNAGEPFAGEGKALKGGRPVR